MRPIPLSALPPEVQKLACAQAGVKVPKASSAHAKTVAMKDVPLSWGRCKEHGMVYSPKEVGCAMCDDPNVPVVNVLVRDQEAQRLAIMVKGVVFCYGASPAQQERFMRTLARSPGNAISYARSLIRDLEEESKLRKTQEEKCPKK